MHLSRVVGYASTSIYWIVGNYFQHYPQRAGLGSAEGQERRGTDDSEQEEESPVPLPPHLQRQLISLLVVLGEDGGGVTHVGSIGVVIRCCGSRPDRTLVRLLCGNERLALTWPRQQYCVGDAGKILMPRPGINVYRGTSALGSCRSFSKAFLPRRPANGARVVRLLRLLQRDRHPAAAEVLTTRPVIVRPGAGDVDRLTLRL